MYAEGLARCQIQSGLHEVQPPSLLLLCLVSSQSCGAKGWAGNVEVTDREPRNPLLSWLQPEETGQLEKSHPEFLTGKLLRGMIYLGYAKNARPSLFFTQTIFQGCLYLQQATLRNGVMSPSGQRGRLLTTLYKSSGCLKLIELQL